MGSKSSANLDDHVEAIKSDVNRLSAWMVGIVIALGVAFIGIFITVGGFLNDSLAEKKAISQDMRDEIKAQNDKIDALTEAIKVSNQQKAQ